GAGDRPSGARAPRAVPVLPLPGAGREDGGKPVRDRGGAAGTRTRRGLGAGGGCRVWLSVPAAAGPPRTARWSARGDEQAVARAARDVRRHLPRPARRAVPAQARASADPARRREGSPARADRHVRGPVELPQPVVAPPRARAPPPLAILRGAGPRPL